jgi:hypothetical protein
MELVHMVESLLASVLVLPLDLVLVLELVLEQYPKVPEE